MQFAGRVRFRLVKSQFRLISEAVQNALTPGIAHPRIFGGQIKADEVASFHNCGHGLGAGSGKRDQNHRAGFGKGLCGRNQAHCQGNGLLGGVADKGMPAVRLARLALLAHQQFVAVTGTGCFRVAPAVRGLLFAWGSAWPWSARCAQEGLCIFPDLRKYRAFFGISQYVPDRAA